jgi:hypothetical protein
MSNSNQIRPRFLALALVGSLAACSNDVVDLGGGTLAQDILYGSRCAESPIVEGEVVVTNQAELDALLGCEEIRGGLQVSVFEDADLAPLAKLRAVDGNFILGGSPHLPTEQYQAIVQAGWLTSLAGVESLERVGNFIILDVGAPNLNAFESLRLVGGNVDGVLSGALSISWAPNLVDLTGLENVRGFRALDISANLSLQSLDGLQLPTTIDRLTLQSNPLLSDIDALLPLTSVLDVFISNTGITSADGLANLRVVSLGLALSNNPELTNADALGNLEGVDYLVFEDCPKLERLPELSNLYGINGFKAMRNASLQAISLNFPKRSSSNYVDGNDVPTAASVIEIGDNEQLESITFEAGFDAVEVLSAYRNASLTRIDLGSLQRLDHLEVRANPLLDEVALGALQTVDVLSVMENPLLSTAELRNVRTFESFFLANADDPPPP